MLNIFREKKIFIANTFLNIQTVKYSLGPLSKKRRFRTSFNSQYVKGSKHLWNQYKRTFIIFFHNSEDRRCGKYLPSWGLKSSGCLLALLVPITSILFGIVRICRSLFKCNYLKNQNFFLSFFVPLMESISNFKHFQRKKIVIANVFVNIMTAKYLAGPLAKKRRFRTSFDSQRVKESQTLAKSAWEHF